MRQERAAVNTIYADFVAAGDRRRDDLATSLLPIMHLRGDLQAKNSLFETDSTRDWTRGSKSGDKRVNNGRLKICPSGPVRDE